MHKIPCFVTPCFVVLLALFLGAATQAVAADQPKAASKPKVEQVIVVFKTHFDIGYTQLAREVVERYRTSMIDKALAVCDESEKLPPESRFVWTLPGWPMAQVLWPGQTAERRQRIEKAIRDGRLVWHGLAGTTHTESMDLETLVRSLGFSSRLARQFNQPLPRDAKMTDVPCHTWIVPTVLKRAGIDFLHLGCNSASGSPDIPMLFWWEGPDGSRLLTMYTAEGYGTGLNPPADWPHKTWLALIHTGDNHGPPEPGEVKKLLDQAQRELPGVKIRLGRLSDFGDAILKENPKLPIVRKDMTDTWIHGIMSMPEEAGSARLGRRKLSSAESLNTLLSLSGVQVPVLKELIEDAYENSFLYSEHTWGASSSYYSPRLYGKQWKEAHAAGKYKYAEESWQEHGDYVRRVQALLSPAIEEQVKTLAASVDVAGPRVVVYNPLPWPRSDTITVSANENAMGVEWQDAATGQRVNAEANGRSLTLAVKDIPGLGYRTYVPAKPAGQAAATSPKKEAQPADPSVLENAFFRVQLDVPRGVIASLIDKRTGRELVDRTSNYGFGQYLYERFDKDYHTKFLNDYCKSHPGWVDEFGRANLPPTSEARYTAASPRKFRLDGSLRLLGLSSARAVAVVAEADPNIPCQVMLWVALPHDRPYLTLGCVLVNNEPDPWPEAGWLCLPFAADQPSYRLGRPGSIIDPAKDIVRAANHEMFCIESGLTITGRDGSGVGLCPVLTPLVSLGRPGAFRFTPEFGSRKPAVFVNVFNNIWGTNFQQWIGGRMAAFVRIWATHGTDDEQNLITPAWEARTPWPAKFLDGPAGKLPPTQSGLELSRKGVLVTAFGPNPDGEGILLRLWEQEGKDGPCKVRLPEALKNAKAQPCDLRGRPMGEPIPNREGTLEVPLTHFAPVSVVLMR